MAAEQGSAAAPVANGSKLSLAQKKKLKAKQRKDARRAEREEFERLRQGSARSQAEQEKEAPEVEVEYVSAPLEFEIPSLVKQEEDGAAEDEEEGASLAAEFARIAERFGAAGDAAERDGEEAAAVKEEEQREASSSGSDSDDEGAGGEAKLSKKKLRALSRMKIAELKQSCVRPEVVEIWDVTAADPQLLVHLKATRNTVPVPRHWSQKRAYLQGKRGVEKPPFKLPAFIEATGIGEMRQAYLEKAEAQRLKSKGRERMQPKMGKLDVDYQVLHDAFFKYQTKPKLTGMGDLYYEGKEYETDVKDAAPGVVSPELREALGLDPGAPPPWLVAMQRYGPPPSYPTLRIPGLNAPIPPGAEFGYHPGGWGKPPVDEEGRPVYGDVFGEQADEAEEDERPFAVVHWGELEEAEESESEEESEEESEPESDEELDDGTASVASGYASTVTGGLETPAEVDLRKDSGPRQLYTVLEQASAPAAGAGVLMGSEHTYVIPGQEEERKPSIAAAKRLEALRKEMPSDLDVALDPSELEGLDDAALRDLYEARVAEARQQGGREDFSDLVAARAAAQKRKAAEKAAAKDTKKFKF
ncbi:hypothetical protein QBZ16_005487 [Prototheca wickerhamii]|uniref:PSP proline-rich domain-containing protein n=1 Tax=Prototheca wickerhamii TaxID=3111 RepID=A0AAD9MHF2_PROWI|nr:hypothetical protein QBZ16_005487 [Prototheca wickerhamii]